MKENIVNNLLRQLPISEYQKRFFVEWVLDPESSRYNVSLTYKLHGDLNKDALKKACEEFIKKHEIMHALYNEDSTECYYGNYAIDEFYSIGVLNTETDVSLQLRNILDQPFDLTKDVLLRFYLLELPGKDNEFY